MSIVILVSLAPGKVILFRGYSWDSFHSEIRSVRKGHPPGATQGSTASTSIVTDVAVQVSAIKTSNLEVFHETAPFKKKTVLGKERHLSRHVFVVFFWLFLIMGDESLPMDFDGILQV